MDVPPEYIGESASPIYSGEYSPRLTSLPTKSNLNNINLNINIIDFYFNIIKFGIDKIDFLHTIESIEKGTE